MGSELIPQPSSQIGPGVRFFWGKPFPPSPGGEARKGIPTRILLGMGLWAAFVDPKLFLCLPVHPLFFFLAFIFSSAVLFSWCCIWHLLEAYEDGSDSCPWLLMLWFRFLRFC